MTTPNIQAPAVGSNWSHTNGNNYQVTLVTNLLSTRAEYPVTVVYTNQANGTVWSRPLTEWYRSMTPVTA